MNSYILNPHFNLEALEHPHPLGCQRGVLEQIWSVDLMSLGCVIFMNPTVELGF